MNRILRCTTAAASLAAAGACTQALKLSRDDSPAVLANQAIVATNPGLPGSFKVKSMYYGSGNDKRRAEYRDSVTLKTTAVDGSAFVTIEGPAAKQREKDWGITPKKLPLNGRVWYPEGDGPFPLVLIVHGNHTPTDYSDPGYKYLGEQLASHGFIMVSVDENFINGLSGENDGRGWLLLKHLERWKKWNDSTGSPFHAKVDMSRIALMGHSRGGEAVAHAATFNRLGHYPDDAKVKMHFNFSIRSIIAIAPVDGQYRPASVFEPLENVNYLVIHGSHDGDVSSFDGLRQFQRTKFTDGNAWFKSAWYVYRANHGQWNSVWQNKDNGPRSARNLDLRGLIPMADQMQFGRVVITAFLQSTLKDRQEYLPMFRDHRVAGEWLPKTMYITRFQSSGYKPVAQFDEDIDVTTGSVAGVRLEGDSLGTLKESGLTLRPATTPLNTNAVWLGWNNKVAGPDTTKRGRPATYTITMSDSLVRAWKVDDRAAICFSVAPQDAKPGPRPLPRDTAKKDSTSKTSTPKTPKAPKAVPDSFPVDFTVQVTDAAGVTASVSVRNYGVPRRPLEVRILRRANQEQLRFANKYEIVLQSYVIPMADLVAVAPALDPTKLRSVRFVFDRAIWGTILLDDVGVWPQADPAFFTARVR
ncbi:MAG: MFS transporter [Gemmatimonadaceae bacterium]